MKKLGLIALTVLGTGVVLAAAAPVTSGPNGSCGAAFEIQDPALRASFAAADRGRSGDFAQLCTVYKADLAVRRTAAE